MGGFSGFQFLHIQCIWYRLRRVLGRTSPGEYWVGLLQVSIGSDFSRYAHYAAALLNLWIFDTLVPTAAAVQKCSVSSMYFLSITVLVSYRRLYGYLKQNLVELSSQKSTRAERNPAVP